MGWAYCGTDWRDREIGYAIEATCDQRGCDERINRGLGCVCGTMHEGGHNNGCGRYYCDRHGGGFPTSARCYSHRGKWAWGRTVCQLMWRYKDRRVGKIIVAEGGKPEIETYYCACHGWEGFGNRVGFKTHVALSGGIGGPVRA